MWACACAFSPRAGAVVSSLAAAPVGARARAKRRVRASAPRSSPRRRRAHRPWGATPTLPCLRACVHVALRAPSPASHTAQAALERARAGAAPSTDSADAAAAAARAINATAGAS
eukprot:scaffold5748_cov202-Prasinococcus_capsulatus_cf.AAC.1